MASDIFTLNAGSSSLKFSLWHSASGTDLGEIFRGEIEKIGIDPQLFAGAEWQGEFSSRL